MKNKNIIFLLFFAIILPFSFVFAEHTISLQGRILDKNGNPLDGEYSFIVRFFDSQIGGSVDFERTVDFVVVKDGFYSIEVSTSGSFDKEYWVEIGVKPQGSQGNYEFFPRYKLTYSPYAVRSKHSEYAKYAAGIVSTSAINMGGFPILDVSTISVSFITSTSPATRPLVIASSVSISNVLNVPYITVSTINVQGLNFKVIESTFVFLLYTDEEPSPETTNTTSTTTLKSWTLPANNYDAIIIESEVGGRNIAKEKNCNFTWRIKLGTYSSKTMVTQIKTDSSNVWVNISAIYPLKAVFPGGQSSNTNILITGEMSTADTNIGIMAYSLRVYGVKKLKLLVAE